MAEHIAAVVVGMVWFFLQTSVILNPPTPKRNNCSELLRKPIQPCTNKVNYISNTYASFKAGYHVEGNTVFVGPLIGRYASTSYKKDKQVVFLSTENSLENLRPTKYREGDINEKNVHITSVFI